MLEDEEQPIELTESEENVEDLTETETQYIIIKETGDDNVLDASRKHLIWETGSDGKQYWYENNIKQGVYGQKGNVFYDNTERGREIYDPSSDGWYWLDTKYNGAKAVDKEVFMPYIYSNEDSFDYYQIEAVANESNWYTENGTTADMAKQIKDAINNKTGKWVRYNSAGKMYKGWYQVQGRDALIYPHQAGNIYYYDFKTGLMAKGWTVIDGKRYHFDEVTGVLDQGTNNLTPYVEPVNIGQFETAEYKYKNDYSTTFLVSVKNNSNTPARVTVRSKAYNSSGKLIDAKSRTIDILGPGEESVVWLWFSDNSVDYITYDLELKTDDLYYYQVINNLSITSSQTTDKVILTIKNNGHYEAQFVEAYVVFYDKNGNIVYIDDRYFTDDDSEIKPGKSITESISCGYKIPFSTFKVFLTGRSKAYFNY